ncbi:MAG TPA: hypothetical protein VJ785_01330 [Anaerolineales bacterium]|nr:hypothetical protein [Anaerolineales bacterium]
MDKHIEDALIEDALKSQPLALMPRSITADVMARIQENSRPALLTWSDFALNLVIASCVGALWFASQNLPPILLAKLRIQSILLYQDFLVNIRWLVPALLFGLAAIFAATTIPFLLKMTMDHRQ